MGVCARVLQEVRECSSFNLPDGVRAREDILVHEETPRRILVYDR